MRISPATTRTLPPLMQTLHLSPGSGSLDVMTLALSISLSLSLSLSPAVRVGCNLIEQVWSNCSRCEVASQRADLANFRPLLAPKPDPLVRRTLSAALTRSVGLQAVGRNRCLHVLSALALSPLSALRSVVLSRSRSQCRLFPAQCDGATASPASNCSRAERLLLLQLRMFN